MAVDAVGIGAVAAGSVFLYAGVRGVSVPAALTAIVQGKSPAGVPVTQAITGTPAAATPAAGGITTAAAAAADVAGSASPQQALADAAAAYGWNTGAQWQALSNVEMAEAGFNPTIVNPTSGALGLAQALGHGQGAATAGSLGNEYGGFGVSDAVARAANSGDAGAQAVWMLAYIAATYGTPEAAWAHEQEFRWY